MPCRTRDINYTWGIGRHGQKQGGAILPDMMRWLWRDHEISTDPNNAVERSFNEPALKKGPGGHRNRAVGRLPPSAFRLPPSAFRLPPSAFRLPPSAFLPSSFFPSSFFRLPSSVF